MTQSLPDLIRGISSTHAQRPAVVGRDHVWTYGELRLRFEALAADLARRGVRPGDRVALLLRNGPEFVAAYLAILASGALAVPLNDHYQQTELLYFLDECGVALLITAEPFRALCETVLPHARKPCPLVFMETLDELPPETGWRPPAVDPDAPAMYQFSSGSTGRPKRIARTHRNLIFELDSFHETLGFTSEDRFLGVAPFSHVNGLMRSMWASLRAGASLYPLPQFDRQAVAGLIEEHRLTVFIAVPFMFITLAQTRFKTAPDWASLRLCISASAPLPARFSREFREKYGIHVRQLYGSTETGTISVNLEPDVSGSLESVGRPIRGVRVAVVDEDGRPAGTGRTGEVLVSSPAAIAGYDGLEELNRQAFRDGFFHTGDLGKLDESGSLYLLGRKKFLINKGGFKIDPREVEQLLEEHPCVEEVAVVGAPTPYGDEKVKAVIVLRAPCTENEIAEFCRGKIADFKIPSTIEFRDSLPKSPTGKVRRPMLAAGSAPAAPMPRLDPHDLYLLVVIAAIRAVGWTRSAWIRDAAARLAADLAYVVSGNKRRQAVAEVRKLFGAEPRRRRTFRTFWRDAFTLAAPGWRGAEPDKTRARGLEHLQAALSRRRGAILLETSFFGLRHYPKCVLHRHGIPTWQVHALDHMAGFLSSRRTRVSEGIVRRFFEEREKRWVQGIIYLPADDSLAFTRRLMEVLQNNGVLCLSGEGRRGRKHVILPLLGRERGFATGVISLAKLTSSPVLPLFCWRGDDGTIHLVVEPPLDRDAGMKDYAGLLESYVQRFPDQYRNWRLPDLEDPGA
ncbi:MAG: AMP-binding protein [Acidobacteria bacterium]|nr:AMP-binding protein [Acidobacteriota bacterium]